MMWGTSWAGLMACVWQWEAVTETSSAEEKLGGLFKAWNDSVTTDYVMGDKLTGADCVLMGSLNYVLGFKMQACPFCTCPSCLLPVGLTPAGTPVHAICNCYHMIATSSDCSLSQGVAHLLLWSPGLRAAVDGPQAIS